MLKNLILALLCVASASAYANTNTNSSTTSASDAVKFSYLRLLVSSDLADVRTGAQSLARDKIFDTALTDVVAERLWQSNPKAGRTESCFNMGSCLMSAQTDGRGRNVDTISWLIDVLANSRNARYQSMMAAMAEQSSDEKIKDKLLDAVAKLQDLGQESFAPNALALPELKAQITAKVPERQARAATGAALTVDLHQPLEHVLAVMGIPDRIGVTDRQMFMGIRASILQLSYFGAGTINFWYEDSAGMNGWHVTQVASEIAHKPLVYNGQMPHLAYALMSGKFDDFRLFAKRLYVEHNFERDLLDVVAERLWLSMNSEQSAEIDGMAFLCRLLGSSRNARYRGVLDDIAQGAKSSKLAGYAKSALAELPDDDTPRYQRSSDTNG